MDKSPDAFRTISEVSEDLDIPQHVLRFWETRFNPIKPLKRGGGRRYYRPDDVDLLRGIRHLLYGQGYTIRGVQRILKEQGVKAVQALGRGEIVVPPPPEPDLPHAEAQEQRALATQNEAEAFLPEDGADAQPSRALPAPGQVSLPLGDDAGHRPLARPTRQAAVMHVLSPDAVRRLGHALAELEECRRLLAAVRSSETTPHGTGQGRG